VRGFGIWDRIRVLEELRKKLSNKAPLLRKEGWQAFRLTRVVLPSSELNELNKLNKLNKLSYKLLATK
jgi:hypothetical protein